MKKTNLRNPDQIAGIDKNLFEQIGIQHNLAVRYILQNLDSRNGEELEHKMNALLKQAIPLEYKIYEESGVALDSNYMKMVMQDESPDYAGYVDGLKISGSLRKFLHELIELFSRSLPIYQFESILLLLGNNAAKNLQQNDLIIFLCSISVAKYSARLWCPENLGGEDAFRYLKNNPSNWNSIQNDVTISLTASTPVKYSTTLSFPGGTGSGISYRKRWNWGKIVLADALGVVSGAVSSVISSGGASALPNPALGGLPTAGAVGLVSGASASGGSAIGQS